LRNRYNSISILILLAFGVLPFASAFIYALLYSFGVIGIVNEGFTLKFWLSVLSTSEFITSFFYSSSIAAVTIAISVGLALLITKTYIKQFDQGFLSFIIYLPLAIPSIVAAFFTLQLLSKGGFFSRIFYKIGWIAEARQFPDFVNDSWAIGIILAFVTMVLPFFVLIYLNIYKNERVGELSELAQSLGASKSQVVRRIYLPIMLGKTKILIALYFIFILGAYEIPLILGQESPQMLSVLILRELKQFDLSKLSEGYVVAVVYTIVVSAVTVLIFSSKRKEHEV